MYKHIWSSHINESLPCKQERHNVHDRLAVAALKDANVVGHIPRNITFSTSLFASVMETSGTSFKKRPFGSGNPALLK